MKLAESNSWRDDACDLDRGWPVDEHSSRATEWHSPQKQRNLSLVTYCDLTDDMVQRGRKGVPLVRSAALMALAEQIASSAETVEFSEEWAESLAKDFIQFDD